MRPSAVTFLMLLALGLVKPALGIERGPVCREPSVVDEITREVRVGNYYSQINTDLVTEQPTADPRIVRCQVCVQSTPFDTPRFGDRAIARCIAHDFEVRIAPRGFVVGAVH